MRNINVTINTRITFVRESLMAMVNDLVIPPKNQCMNK